ncbi:reverse transcriptase domain-containing protein [Tanacetum coccineum]
MQKYLSKAKDLIARFESFSITQVPRSQNKQADALSKMASMSFAYLKKKVLVEVLPCKSIEGVEIMAIVEEVGSTWMTPIKEYLEKGTLPKEKRKGTTVERKSKIIRASRRDLIPEVILRTMVTMCWTRTSQLERRELAAIAEEKHKRKMEGYYKLKVWNTILRLRDLVYRSNEASRKEDTGKLGPK